MMDITKNTTARTMVNWKRVFSRPRRVRKLPWALPKKPEPVSRTCISITTMRIIDTKIWATCNGDANAIYSPQDVLSASSLSLTRSFTRAGFAFPLVIFITCPTRCLAAVSLPFR